MFIISKKRASQHAFTRTNFEPGSTLCCFLHLLCAEARSLNQGLLSLFFGSIFIASDCSFLDERTETGFQTSFWFKYVFPQLPHNSTVRY